MKNKLLMGLLLAAQISGIKAKLDWGNRPGDIYRNYGPASFDPAEQEKMAKIKAEGKAYQAQQAAYNAYVKAMKASTDQVMAEADAHQMEYIKQHPNQPIPSYNVLVKEPMKFEDWLNNGRPQR